MLEMYFGQPLVVPGDGATRVEFEHESEVCDLDTKPSVPGDQQPLEVSKEGGKITKS